MRVKEFCLLLTLFYVNLLFACCCQEKHMKPLKEGEEKSEIRAMNEFRSYF